MFSLISLFFTRFLKEAELKIQAYVNKQKTMYVHF